MNTTVTPTRDDVVAFAEAVRRRLDDLAPEEVDDLTEGLVADLSEQADEDATFRLPDADAYADELRTAAGLAPRDESAPARERYLVRLRREWRDMLFSLRQRPRIAAVLDFLGSVRPAWWVLRGLVVGSLLSLALGGSVIPNGFSVLLILAVVIVSVQWGRGRWLPWRWLHVVRFVASVIAIVAALPLAFGTVNSIRQDAYTVAADWAWTPDPSGLRLDGERVWNIFAYDADGNALSGVQLFAQDGSPLVTVSRDNADLYEDAGDGTLIAAYLTPDQRRLWNVYPLRLLTFEQVEQGTVDVNDAALPTPPFSTGAPLGDAVSAWALRLPSVAPQPSVDPSDAPDADVPETDAPGTDAPDGGPAPEPEPTPVADSD